jgi:hypothetical protein
MNKSILLIKTLTIFIVITYALGCSCPERTAEDDFKNADAVFDGQVLRIKPVNYDNIVHFKVLNVYKGEKKEFLDVATAKDTGAMCGFGFEINKNYKVYASKEEGGLLHTSICWKTSLIE